jgi:hypothetical protein
VEQRMQFSPVPFALSGAKQSGQTQNSSNAAVT